MTGRDLGQPRRPRRRGLGWLLLVALVAVVAAFVLSGAVSRDQPPGTSPPTIARCAPPGTYLAKGHASPCLTPGVIRSSDPAVICVKGAASKARAELTSAEWSARRAEVMRRYGLTSLKGYTVDHLLPLEGGGSNSVENLVPQQSVIAKGKDKAEGGLHRGICPKEPTHVEGVTVAKVRALQQAFIAQWVG